MSFGIYVSPDGTARRAKYVYVGDANGIARKAKKIYFGVADSSPRSGQPTFYSGTTPLPVTDEVARAVKTY